MARSQQRGNQMPNPMDPVIITRDLRVFRKKKKGVKQRPPLQVRNLPLIELIKHCLYEVASHQREDLADVEELRPGRILSRNLKLSERLSDAVRVPYAEQGFISYKDVFLARRGMAHANHRTTAVEMPALRGWHNGLDALKVKSWSIVAIDEEGRRQFVAIAQGLIDVHAHVIDEDKCRTLALTLQAGSLTDRLGRFNPCRIPLIIFAGQRHLRQRVLAAPIIAHHMDFRGVVLTAYIHQLNEICQDVAHSQLYRLRSASLFGEHRLRPPRKAIGSDPVHQRGVRRVEQEADRLTAAADRLEQIRTRPFNRSLVNHAPEDLRESARFMREAATMARDGHPDEAAGIMLGAREGLIRVYHSMTLRRVDWRIEEVLLEAVVMKDRGESVSSSLQPQWCNEFTALMMLLARKDPATDKYLDDGYTVPVRLRTLAHVKEARSHLMRQLADGGPDLDSMIESLKKASDPL